MNAYLYSFTQKLPNADGSLLGPFHSSELVYQFGTLYTGWTNCLARRMKAHNEGKAGAKYTRAKRPVKLVYYEGFATREEAMSREYRIKRLTREKKLELMKF